MKNSLPSSLRIARLFLRPQQYNPFPCHAQCPPSGRSHAPYTISDAVLQIILHMVLYIVFKTLLYTVHRMVLHTVLYTTSVTVFHISLYISSQNSSSGPSHSTGHSPLHGLHMHSFLHGLQQAFLTTPTRFSNGLLLGPLKGHLHIPFARSLTLSSQCFSH